ncbi:hypothetical protein HMPREF1546_00702 [Oscillibacter sp. KLE 1745]|nr:hypothetical protein HMPREF1546_00702 [Oscillibacter sp. KLE 1745]
MAASCFPGCPCPDTLLFHVRLYRLPRVKATVLSKSPYFPTFYR